MTLKLYGSKGSGSAAIQMALRAAGLEYQQVWASSWEADSARAELLQLNPLGQIPTLRLTDGTVLSESAAILIHLGLDYPAAGLLPAAPSARAVHLRALVFIAANCYAAVSVSDFPERWTTSSAKSAHDEVRAAARLQLHRSWNIFADSFGSALDGEEGEEPGALAFLAVVVSQWSGSRAHLKTERPEFYAQLLRLEAHPRLADILREHRKQD